MFPPATAGDGRRRLPGLRRPVEPDPRRLRRVRGAVRARGAPLGDRLRLLDDRRARWRRSATARRSASTGTRSHFVWQDLDPVGFLWDFKDRIYHVDCKDTKLQVGNGRNGRLGSHLPWADPRRGWDFVSTGHGDVPVGAVLPDAQHHRLRRPDLGRVGGRRHGPPASARPRRWSSSAGSPSTHPTPPSTRRSRPRSNSVVPGRPAREHVHVSGRKFVMCFGYDGEGALRRSLEEKGASRRSLFRGAAAGVAGAAVLGSGLAAPASAHSGHGARAQPAVGAARPDQHPALHAARRHGRPARLRHRAHPARAIRLREGRVRRLLRPHRPADPRPARRPRHQGVLEPRRDQRRRGGPAHQAPERGDARAAVRRRALPQLELAVGLEDLGPPDERRGGGREASTGCATATTTTPTSSRSTSVAG